MISLVSRENATIFVSRERGKISPFLAAATAASDDEVIKLSTISTEVLEKIVFYLNYRKGAEETPKELVKNEDDEKFINGLSLVMLVQLKDAANTLRLDRLLEIVLNKLLVVLPDQQTSDPATGVSETTPVSSSSTENLEKKESTSAQEKEEKGETDHQPLPTSQPTPSAEKSNCDTVLPTPSITLPTLPANFTIVLPTPLPTTFSVSPTPQVAPQVAPTTVAPQVATLLTALPPGIHFPPALVSLGNDLSKPMFGTTATPLPQTQTTIESVCPCNTRVSYCKSYSACKKKAQMKKILKITAFGSAMLGIGFFAGKYHSRLAKC